MKKTNWVKRGAVAVVMAGMLAATPVVANAATISESLKGVPSIVKNWTVASDTQFDANAEFTFNLHYTGATEQNGITTADPTLAGGAELTDQTVTLKGSDLQKGADGTYTGSTSLVNALKNVDFSKPGNYSFKLTEVAGDNANVNYDGASYTVTVGVAWVVDGNNVPTDQTEVKDVVVKDANGGKPTEATFNNTAKASDSLEVSKTVAGTAADTTKDFDYTLSLTGGTTGSYDVYKDGKKFDTVSAEKSVSFKLKHGESIEVKNLPEGASYSVAETGTDYEESYVVTTGGKTAGAVNNNVDAGADITASGTIEGGTNSVAFKNEKGFAPNTGITMNTLPFVGIAVVAAGGVATLVISRKRRAGEDF